MSSKPTTAPVADTSAGRSCGEVGNPTGSNIPAGRHEGQGARRQRLPGPGARRATLQPRLAVPAGLVILAALVAGCTDTGTPSDVALDPMPSHLNHSAAHSEKGYINGWLDGEDVSLFYTKWFFCAEPPASGAATGCVLGADAEVFPRPGPIPAIYAVAPVGFQPDPATLSCRAGTPCLNHPAMLDASRVAGPAATNVPAQPHSHVIGELRGGWWQTVNIRVFHPDVWNEIVATKSLERIRELQADPAVGGAGLISSDTPTNIFFFISAQPDHPNK